MLEAKRKTFRVITLAIYALLIFAVFLPIAKSSTDQSALLKSILAKCPGAARVTSTKSFSLKDLNGPPARVNSLSHPISNGIVFRGIREENPQFDESKVVRTILGDPFYLPSPMMWGIEMVFKGDRRMSSPFLPVGQLPLTMEEYFRIRGILSEIEGLLYCHRNKSFSSDEITYLAKNLMDLSFNQMTKNEIVARYLNMKDHYYYSKSILDYGFGNNGIDMVISSYYDQIASFYGSKILVYKDTRDRSIDLGFFNYKTNGRFWDHWIDNGEVNTPGYLYPSDISGFQRRAKNREFGQPAVGEPRNPIIYGIYKWTDDEKNTFAILVAGYNKLCLLQAPDSQKVFFCEENWTGQLGTPGTPLPRVTDFSNSNKAPILGVFSDCLESATCSIQKVFDSYGTDGAKALPYLSKLRDGPLSGLMNLTLGDGRTKVHFTATPNPSSERPAVVQGPRPRSAQSTINVVSATYVPATPGVGGSKLRGNVTNSAHEFLKGKTSESYKISHQFLGLAAPTESMAFEIIWTCGDSKKRNQELLNDNAEGKKLQIKCEEKEM
ncbi:MAG: hypothetical protein JNM39_10935 [Bdellovibrionaceae bacterium]|nr:hypothetical protein [Pseudobdellovibrionaceae bacterium]